MNMLTQTPQLPLGQISLDVRWVSGRSGMPVWKVCSEAFGNSVTCTAFDTTSSILESLARSTGRSVPPHPATQSPAPPPFTSEVTTPHRLAGPGSVLLPTKTGCLCRMSEQSSEKGRACSAVASPVHVLSSPARSPISFSEVSTLFLSSGMV